MSDVKRYKLWDSDINAACYRDVVLASDYDRLKRERDLLLDGINGLVESIGISPRPESVDLDSVEYMLRGWLKNAEFGGENE